MVNSFAIQGMQFRRFGMFIIVGVNEMKHVLRNIFKTSCCSLFTCLIASLFFIIIKNLCVNEFLTFFILGKRKFYITC